MEDLLNVTHVPNSLKLIELCAEPDSRLTETALTMGIQAERWTKDDFDLSTDIGYLRASRRLIEVRPNKLWLSPPCAPFTTLQFMRPAKDLELKQKHGKKIWKNCMKLAILQIKLGGDAYVEQPFRCGTWRLDDPKQ